MKPWVERIYNGIVKENPSFVLMLGMCPTLAVTTSASNGIGMGLSTMAVLIVSNLIISLVRKIVPDDVRLPAYIVIVASLVTVVELLMEAYTPSIYSALGCKLYHPWTCRGICIQESAVPVCNGWCRHGSGIHDRPASDRYGQRTCGSRNPVWYTGNSGSL